MTKMRQQRQQGLDLTPYNCQSSSPADLIDNSEFALGGQYDFSPNDFQSFTDLDDSYNKFLPTLENDSNLMASRAANILNAPTATMRDTQMRPQVPRSLTSPVGPCGMTCSSLSTSMDQATYTIRNDSPSTSPSGSDTNRGEAITPTETMKVRKCSSSATDVEIKSETKASKHWSGLQRRRMPHHVVERRYRDNLNSTIDGLRSCIPSLAEQPEPMDLEDAAPAKLPSKASVIAAARDYIKELQNTENKLLSETDELRQQVDGLQKLVQCDNCPVMARFNSIQFGSMAR